MRNIKLTIEYDGTHFKGWQIQGKNERTVQNEIKLAAKKFLNENITLIGAGRTDSGVHALGQVAHFKTNSLFAALQIQKAFNAHLPPDVSIIKAEDAPKNFHAQYQAKNKIYRYTILNRNARASQLRHFCLHHPHRIDVKKMREAARSLIGKRNFRSFQSLNRSNRSAAQSTVRRIKKITITKKEDHIYIDIEADGFLYRMVRNIAGCLMDVGSGRLSAQDIKGILHSHDRTKARKSLPAKGLCLLSVNY